MAQIFKRFVGTVAVRGVDLELQGGEVHALVGENGAGKSTLMRVLAGAYADYSGDIQINGAPARIETPRRARELGIAMVHQELSLVPELSVAENMFLGREAPSRIPGLIDRRIVEGRAGAILRGNRGGRVPEPKGREPVPRQAATGRDRQGTIDRARAF